MMIFWALLSIPAISFAQSSEESPPTPGKSSGAEVSTPSKPSGDTAPEPKQPDAPMPNKPAAVAIPVKPGAVRVTTKAPDPDKWDAQRSANGLQRVFKCNPLACADAETISFVFSKSPTRHPDPLALKKFAEVDLPKSIRAAAAARAVLSDGEQKIETLSSKTSTLKNYPAVISETKLSQGKHSIFLETVILFSGPAMIRVSSTSPNRDLAQKTLNQFIDTMKIEEGPPLQPGSPSPTIPSSVEGSEQL